MSAIYFEMHKKWFDRKTEGWIQEWACGKKVW